ncbi:hypothetical protein UCDDS831_g08180 [Diplodia seriata]|uniref:BTB domain-containing protein n=1 Tax=Diplodia seriata TaxID=420778 RepID=A0A0G2GBL2_9PEZI|nr:hypothetical protein UCDDS831_g08180 [Diplodia seriata]
MTMAKDKAAPDKAPSFTDGTLSSATTSVFVGSDREKFVTYTDLLRHSSHWFDAQFDVTDPKHLVLPDVSPAVFRVFLDWIRSDGDQLPDWNVREGRDMASEPVKVGDDEFLENGLASYHFSQPEAEALECYMFAVEYEIRLFKNDLFDCILEMNSGGNLVPSYSIVLRVWQASVPAPLMRKYLVDVYARNWTNAADLGCREELILRKQVPADFWISVLIQREEHGEFSDNYPPWEENLCQYHDHTDKDKHTCYWQHINDGEGYCTDYTDYDSDDSMLDEYESDFIDDSGLDSEDESKPGLPQLEAGDMQNENMKPMKTEPDSYGGYNSSDSGASRGSMTL